MSKLYRGVRQEREAVVYVDNVKLDIEPSRKLRPSDATYEWGYLGSGPQQLAIAILLDATGSESTTLAHYTAFKYDFIGPAEFQGFTILESQIHDWLKKQVNEQGD